VDRFTQTLERHWGFTSFRPGQREVIEAVVSGRPVLGVMPTGAGKSLCYQLPALMLPGVTLVVSPLIALMKDQVDQLRQRGIAAACINSTVPLDEQQRLLEDARSGHLKLLYVAPERFRYEGAMARLKRLPIGLFAIDEAHCISHWGHDFRPDYQLLGPAYRELAVPRVAAYTATATAEVRRDIVGSLDLKDPLVTVAGFARPNLHLSVLPIARMKDKPRLALAAIRGGLSAAGPGVAIVYCATRKHCDQAYDALTGHGFDVHVYHGGLDDDARKRAQEAFQSGSRTIMIATNAFGMGVDKAEVRVVIHWDFPGSVDAYYQEVGRAGRDGKRAYGVMLFTYADSRIHEFFIEQSGENLEAEVRAARAEADRQKLKAIQRFAYHEGCRHSALLRYFGDRAKDCDLSDPAGSRCDNCAGKTGLDKVHLTEATSRPRRDIADEDGPRHAARRLTEPEEIVVQKALSAVSRARGLLELKGVARALRGSKANDVIKGPLYGTKSFGMLDELPEATVVSLLRALSRAGCIQGRKPVVTALGTEVMWRRQSVLLEMPPFSHEGLKKRTPADDSAVVSADSTLIRALKQRRLALAKTRGVAPFVIASNALLDRLATLAPDASTSDWLKVKGVGEQNVGPLREAFKAIVDAAGEES
jgi:ATP-dependent DNA helicase RecQ